MTVSPEKIAEMLAAAEKATPGPWERQAKTDTYTHIVRGPGNAYIAAAPQGSKGQQVADVVHIANCDPQTIADILTELVSLRSQLSGITEETSSDRAWKALKEIEGIARQAEIYATGPSARLSAGEQFAKIAALARAEWPLS